MNRPNYTILRCCTTDKLRVMDLLCDADEYKLARDHVDVVYYNGEMQEMQQDTLETVSRNIVLLSSHGITADTRPEYLDDWFFIYN